MGKEYAQKFLVRFSRLFRASGCWAQAQLRYWHGVSTISCRGQRFETLTAVVHQRDCRAALVIVREEQATAGASRGNDIKSERFMAAAGGRAGARGHDPQMAHMQRLRDASKSLVETGEAVLLVRWRLGGGGDKMDVIRRSDRAHPVTTGL